MCLAYDCLYPYTVGGAERWYRFLAEAFAEAGHDVTFLTRLQWPVDDPPDLPGVDVVAVSPDEPLYGNDGTRRLLPPLRFGRGVLAHLVANRHAYDLVHTCSFPFFSLLGCRLALVGSPVAVSVDWFEVWTHRYWRSYVGAFTGTVGWAVQRLCVRLTPLAFVYSGLHERRLRQEGLRSLPLRLPGLYTATADAHRTPRSPGPPTVVFAGRHIREKAPAAVPAAIAHARRTIPDLRGLVLGDGPERAAVLRSIDELGLTGIVEAPGFVPAWRVAEAVGGAACLLLPSTREGYGLVVVEAAAYGTPSVVAPGCDTAAPELIEAGVNGYVAPSAAPADLATAVVRAVRGGEALRASTAAWYRRRAVELDAATSAETIVEMAVQAVRSRA